MGIRREQYDVFAPLRPAYADALRVVPDLGVPGFPPSDLPPTRGELSIDEFYGKRLLATTHIGGRCLQETCIFVDKLYPHAPYDMMLVSTDDPIRSSVVDISPAALRFALSCGAEFVRFVGADSTIDRYSLGDGYFHLCLNYDPFTTDRENGMSYEKGFHVHYNYWPGSILADHLTPCRLNEIDDLHQRRRLVDPLAYLGPRIALDFAQFKGYSVDLLPLDVRRDVALGLPPGIKFRLAAWASLSSPEAVDDIREIHTILSSAYCTVREAFTGSAAPAVAKWERPTLLPRSVIKAKVDEIAWLTPKSRVGLTWLADHLRTLSPRVLRRFQENPRERIRHLSLAGLDYSIGFYSPQANRQGLPLIEAPTVYGVVQTRLFGDSGSAGLPPMGRVPIVRLRRGARDFSPVEIVARCAFHADFLETLRQSSSEHLATHEQATDTRI